LNRYQGLFVLAKKEKRGVELFLGEIKVGVHVVFLALNEQGLHKSEKEIHK